MARKYKCEKALIYILRTPGVNRPILKIGITSDLKRRLKILRTACPYIVQLVETFEVNASAVHKLEAIIHKRLKDRRVRGEWFDTTTERALKTTTEVLIKYSDEAFGPRQSALQRISKMLADAIRPTAQETAQLEHELAELACA